MFGSWNGSSRCDWTPVKLEDGNGVMTPCFDAFCFEPLLSVQSSQVSELVWSEYVMYQVSESSPGFDCRLSPSVVWCSRVSSSVAECRRVSSGVAVAECRRVSSGVAEFRLVLSSVVECG